MENTDLTQYVVPKYLPVTMSRGTFAVNDIVETSASAAVLGQASVKFRVASPNHKDGSYNNPTETLQRCILPNVGEFTLPTAYSSTSEILNVDTADMGLQNNIENIVKLSKSVWALNYQNIGCIDADFSDQSVIFQHFLDLPEKSDENSSKSQNLCETFAPTFANFRKFTIVYLNNSAIIWILIIWLYFGCSL